MMSDKTIASWIGIVLGGVAYLSVPGVRLLGEPPPTEIAPQATASNLRPAHVSAERALLDKYCVTCHNQRLLTAGLTLGNLNVEDVAKDAEVWEKVVRKVKTGAMPPSRAPRPDPAADSPSAP